MRCRQCGRKIQHNNFCVYCGARIIESQNRARDNSLNHDPGFKVQSPFGREERQRQRTDKGPEDSRAGKKPYDDLQDNHRKVRRIIVIAILAGIAVASLCTGTLLLMLNKHHNDGSADSAVNSDAAQSPLPATIDYSRYNGLWYAGQYYSEHDIFDQMLEFEMMSPDTARIKWDRYRIAGFSTIANVNTESGIASFLFQDLGSSISGTLRLVNDTITLHIDSSDNAQIKVGDDYPYSEKRNLTPIKDGKYYAKIFSIKQDKIVSLLLKEQYALDDSVIPTLAEGSIVSVDEKNYYCSGYRAPGTYDGFTALKPTYYFKANPNAEYNSFHVSPSGLNGEWALYAPSDNPMLKDKGSFELGMDDKVSVKDGLINMYNGGLPEDSTIYELLNRYGDDFYTHYFIITIKNRHIVEIEIVYMA